jgi:hypothetical protein
MEHALECHEARLPNLGLPAVGPVRWFLLARPLARLTGDFRNQVEVRVVMHHAEPFCLRRRSNEQVSHSR